MCKAPSNGSLGSLDGRGGGGGGAYIPPGRGMNGRGVHSSTLQVDLRRFITNNHKTTERIPQKLVAGSRKCGRVRPLSRSACAIFFAVTQKAPSVSHMSWLRRAGNVDECAALMNGPDMGQQGADDAWEEDSTKYPLLRALMVAALYPQIVSVEMPPAKAGRCRLTLAKPR